MKTEELPGPDPRAESQGLAESILSGLAIR